MGLKSRKRFQSWKWSVRPTLPLSQVSLSLFGHHTSASVPVQGCNERRHTRPFSVGDFTTPPADYLESQIPGKRERGTRRNLTMEKRNLHPPKPAKAGPKQNGQNDGRVCRNARSWKRKRTTNPDTSCSFTDAHICFSSAHSVSLAAFSRTSF